MQEKEIEQASRKRNQLPLHIAFTLLLPPTSFFGLVISCISGPKEEEEPGPM